jgi:hypothetical protein
MRWIYAVGLFGLACSAEGSGRDCVLNETRLCVGTDGARGVATCEESGWGVCDTTPAAPEQSGMNPEPSGEGQPAAPAAPSEDEPDSPQADPKPAGPTPEEPARPAPEPVCTPGEVTLTPFGCSATLDEYKTCRADGTGWEDVVCVPAPMPGYADQCVETQLLIGQYDVTVTREDLDLYSFTSGTATGLLETQFCFEFVFFDLALLDVLGFGVDKLYFSNGAECDVVGVCIDN